MSDTVRGWRGRRDRRPWPRGRRLARQGDSCPSCARHAAGSGPTMCHPVSSEAARPGHRRDRSFTGARSDVRFQTLRVTGARAQRRRRASGPGPCAPSSVPVARCGGDHVVECAVRSAAHRSPFRPGPAAAASSPGPGHPYRPSGPDDGFFHHPPSRRLDSCISPQGHGPDLSPRLPTPVSTPPASRILAARRRHPAQTPPDPWSSSLAHAPHSSPTRARQRTWTEEGGAPAHRSVRGQTYGPARRPGVPTALAHSGRSTRPPDRHLGAARRHGCVRPGRRGHTRGEHTGPPEGQVVPSRSSDRCGCFLRWRAGVQAAH